MLSDRAKMDIVLMEDEVAGNPHYVHLPKDTARELTKELRRLRRMENSITRVASKVCFEAEMSDIDPEKVRKAAHELLKLMREVRE